MPDEAVVRGHGLVKRFGSGTSAVEALRAASTWRSPGSFTAIMGPSGSGKSTLLHIPAGSTGPPRWVEIAGTRLDRLNDRDLTPLRRREVGFVFQSYNLLPVLTAEENITLPLRIGGARVDREWPGHACRLRRSRGPAHAPAGGDVRRPAAAGRGRARPDHASGRGVRRRADRKPRLRVKPRDPRARARSTTSGRRS